MKPVAFRNLGTTAFTVQPWSYIPPGAASPAAPPNASTVAFPASRGYLSLPLGRYTWCYWWELGDTDQDGRLDYAHALYEQPVVLDEDDSDSLELAETVDLSTTAGTGELPGVCGASPNPSGSAARPEPRSNGELLLEDDCDGSGSARAMFGSDFMDFSYQGGQAQLRASANGLVLPAMTAGPLVGDFILEYDLEDFSAREGGRYGVIFRSDDVTDGLEHYYLISLLPADRMIEFKVWKGNQWLSSTLSPIADESISLDTPLRFRLEVGGSQFRAFLDGLFAAEFMDGQNADPGILGISVISEHAPETLTFDNLRVYALK